MNIGGVWITNYDDKLYFATGFEVNDERSEHGLFVVNAVLVSGERVMVTGAEIEEDAFKHLREISEIVRAIRA